jgi:hypothetical protein
MLITEAKPVFLLQDLQAEIRLLKNNLQKANQRLHRIQRIIGPDAGSTTAGAATESLSNQRLHQIPNIIGLEAIDGPTMGGPLPEANTNPRVVNADNFVCTSNEEGFCPGNCVVINWDCFKFRRSTEYMPKKTTKEKKEKLQW